jgi:hypothetical protein
MDAEVDRVVDEILGRADRRPKGLRLVLGALGVVEVGVEPVLVVWRNRFRHRPGDAQRVLVAGAHPPLDLERRLGRGLRPDPAQVGLVAGVEVLAVECERGQHRLLRPVRAPQRIEVEQRTCLARTHPEAQRGASVDPRGPGPEVIGDVNLGDVDPKRIGELGRQRILGRA